MTPTSHSRSATHRKKRRKTISPYEKRLKKLVRFPMQVISLPLTLVYYELIMIILRGNNVNLFYPVFFAAGIGLMLSALLLLLPRKHYLRIKGALIGIFAVTFIAECLLKSSFQQYMPFNVILHGVTGVVGHYYGQLFAAIFFGIPVIFFYLLPLGLFIACYRRWRLKITQPQLRQIIMGAAGVMVFFLAWIFAITGKTATLYKDSYSFNTATQKFGLLTSIRLDVKYSLFGNKYQNDFVLPSSDPVTTPVTTSSSEQTPDEILSVSESDVLSASAVDETPVEQTNATVSQPVAYDELNIMNIDFDSLIASSDDEVIQQLHQYVQSLSATHKNNYTGAFAGKNLILITAEALSDCAVDPNLTPTLYRMMNNGIKFEDFYQPSWGGSTSTGEFSFVTGLIPLDGEETILETQNNNLYFTLGNALQREGYFSRAYHNGDNEYYGRYLTHENLGYSQFIASYQGLEDLTGDTYPPDTEMFDVTLDTYINNAPFSTYYMSLSGHSNYVADKVFVDKYLDIVNQYYGDRYKDTTKYYLCYQMEFDRALEIVINKLEAAGIADDTVIAICPDHYPYGLEESATFGNSEDYLSDLYGYTYTNWWNLDHSVGIIWSTCMEKDPSEEGYVAPTTISTVSYSIDMVPTLLNLFGIEYDSRLLPGRDVLDPTTEGLVVWENCSWLTDSIYHDSSSGNNYLTDGSNNLAGSEWDAYIAQMDAIVKNKRLYSGRVVWKDYFGILFGEDTCK